MIDSEIKEELQSKEHKFHLNNAKTGGRCHQKITPKGKKRKPKRKCRPNHIHTI
jgi:hypothetical protein